MSGWSGRIADRIVWGAVVLTIVGVLGLFGSAASGIARSLQADGGTPEPRRAGVCEVPDPAERPPLSDGTGVGQGPDATAGATPDPEAQALQIDIERVVDALAACLSAGQHDVVAELATDRYLGVLAGTGGVLTDESYVALAQALPTVAVTIRSIADVRREGANGASADVVYVVANQLIHGRWSFVHPVDPSPDAAETPAAGASGVGERWLVDGEQPLPVSAPPDASRIDVELDEYEIDLEREQVESEGGALVLAIRNVGEREHELLVLGLAGETEPADLLRSPGPSLPEGFAFAGQVTLPPDGQAELILVDLDPGRYALVSLLPDEAGMPGLARGMEAELVVE